MTSNDTFGRDLSRWLLEDGEHRVPDHLGEVLVRTAATRQRPWWSSPERWLPMDTVASGRVANLRPVALLLLISALLVALVGVAVVASQRTTTPAWGLADNGRIFVVAGDSVRSYAADGTDPAVVVDVPSGAAGASISPDGRFLAYQIDVNGGQLEILDIARGDTRTIALPPGISAGNQVSWSSDSARFAFLAFDGVNEHIYVGSRNGAAATEIGADSLPAATELWSLSWSPDSEWIAFGGIDKSTRVGTVYLIRPDGSDLRDIVSPVQIGEAGGVTWSPDPAVARLSYVSPSGVHVHDVTTGESTRVGPGFWPTWSPDGQKLSWWDGALVVGASSDLPISADEVTLVFERLSGACSDHPELARKVICAPAVWSPDGTRVLGPDTVGESIVSLPIDGSGRAIVLPLDPDIENATVDWQPIR